MNKLSEAFGSKDDTLPCKCQAHSSFRQKIEIRGITPAQKKQGSLNGNILNYCYPENKNLLERVLKDLSWFADRF